MSTHRCFQWPRYKSCLKRGSWSIRGFPTLIHLSPPTGSDPWRTEVVHRGLGEQGIGRYNARSSIVEAGRRAICVSRSRSCRRAVRRVVVGGVCWRDRSADIPAVATVLAHDQASAVLPAAEPLGKIGRYRVPFNRWRRYDQIGEPEAFLRAWHGRCGDRSDRLSGLPTSR
jgi:hypothetical protein